MGKTWAILETEVIKGTVDIQGLVALYPSRDMQGVFITWMCTAPLNNKQLGNEPGYVGVGGHLFAFRRFMDGAESDKGSGD